MTSQTSAWSTQQDSPTAGRARPRGRRLGWRRALAALGAALFALLPLAPTALAAQTLSITTPYPSVTVAPGAKVSLDLTVKTTDPAQVGLAVGGTPTGWTATLHGGGFIVSAVQTDVQPPQANTTPQGPQATARLDITVPTDATNGSTKLTITASTGGLTSAVTAEIVVSSTAAGNVTLTTDVPDRRGPSSSSYVFNLTLNNDSAEDLTFTSTGTGPSGWTISSTIGGTAQAASAVVKAGSSNGITITANPPSTVSAGNYEVDVTVNAGTQTLTQKLTIEITGTYTANVSTPDQVLSNHGTAGGTIDQQLVINNTGTADLTNVTPNFSGPTGWNVTFDPTTIDKVPANGSTNFTAKIVPSSDAIAGDYVVTFRVTNDQITQSVDIRVTIESSPLWVAVGILLIVAVGGGLWWVFQRYGRR